jgi:hypothetical protein
VETQIDKKSFGVYVGLINSLRGYDISVKQALQDPNMVAMFNVFHDISLLPDFQITAASSVSTKRASLNKVNVNKVDRMVLEAIQAHPDSTRAELVEYVGRSLQTITGAVNRLINKKLVYVSGKKFDSITSRDVGSLKAYK